MICIETYDDKYLDEVLELVKKQFNYSDDCDFRKSYETMLSYSWCKNDQRIQDKNGLVILDEGKVVGFLGAYYSNRSTEKDVQYIYMNCVRYAIKSCYSMYLFPALKRLISQADVVSDFTASSVMHEVFVDLYKFKECCDVQIRFFPVPFIKNTNDNVIINEIIQNEYQNNKFLKDHEKHHCYALRMISGEDEGCVYWKECYSEKTASSFIRITRVENKELFSENLWEIIWNIQRTLIGEGSTIEDVGEDLFRRIKSNQLFMTECDGMFLEDVNNIKHPLFIKVPVHRLFLNNTNNILDQDIQYDLLYSEMSI